MNARLQRFTTISLLGIVAVASILLWFSVSPYPFLSWLVLATLALAIAIWRYAPPAVRTRWFTVAGPGCVLVGIGLYIAGTRTVEVLNESGQRLELSHVAFDDYLLAGGSLPDGTGVSTSFHSLTYSGSVRVFGQLGDGTRVSSLLTGDGPEQVPSSTRFVRVVVLPGGTLRYQ